MKVLKDGTELRLAPKRNRASRSGLGTARRGRRRPCVHGAEGPAFTAQHADLAQYADGLGGAPPRVPPNRGMGLELDEPMPRSRPVKPKV